MLVIAPCSDCEVLDYRFPGINDVISNRNGSTSLLQLENDPQVPACLLQFLGIGRPPIDQNAIALVDPLTDRSELGVTIASWVEDIGERVDIDNNAHLYTSKSLISSRTKKSRNSVG